LRSWPRSGYLRRRLVSRFDGNEVADLADHPADGGSILEDDRLVRTAQAEALEGLVLLARAADAALDLGDFQLDRHGVLRRGAPSCADTDPTRPCRASWGP